MTDSSNPEIMLKTVGLTKRYGEITALEDLNLTIARGQVFGYVGHNGAGKTTTIRILAGLLSATEGQAIIAGTDLTGDRDRLKQVVGYMPDEFGVYDQMRVWEYLDFFGAAFKIPRRERKQRIDEVLDITEAEYMRDRFVDTLSKGMKQKVGIARTLMHDPQLLLLDEPANGLDPRARIEQRNLIRQLAERGKTLLVSSHILPELASVCDLVGIIHQGRMQAFGPLEEVLGSIRRDRIMELKINTGGQTVAEWLGKHPSCRKVDTADLKMGIIHFRFSGDDAAQADLLRRLIAGNVKVASFREVPLSLEDAFMALSGMTAEEQEEQEVENAADAAPAAAATAQAAPVDDQASEPKA